MRGRAHTPRKTTRRVLVKRVPAMSHVDVADVSS